MHPIFSIWNCSTAKFIGSGSQIFITKFNFGIHDTETGNKLFKFAKLEKFGEKKFSLFFKWKLNATWNPFLCQYDCQLNGSTCFFFRGLFYIPFYAVGLLAVEIWWKLEWKLEIGEKLSVKWNWKSSLLQLFKLG